MQNMVNFGISLPSECFTLVKSEARDRYYKIISYGDWWWGKCDHLKVVAYPDDSFEYELGYFENNKWIVMFGWGYDWENIVEGNI